ncbi:MAG TPA: exodeoxyribonuclease VII large subunit, partial [Gallionellaceae bacterium]|nr:exodeoxyribonuclease VII large subunit [Gallionellaceae bacterium]
AVQERLWRWQTLQQRLLAARPDLARLAMRQAELARRLQEAMHRALERHDARLLAAGQHLQHLDPRQVLARGYSMVRDEHGAIVTSSAAVQAGARLDITLAQGWVQAEVKEKGE